MSKVVTPFELMNTPPMQIRADLAIHGKEFTTLKAIAKKTGKTLGDVSVVINHAALIFGAIAEEMAEGGEN